MKMSKRILRRIVLSKMFDYLHTQYAVESPNPQESLSMNELSGLLAYKSDPLLDEYCRALNQIETGTYGICLSCKSHIAGNALHHNPLRRMCSHCESDVNHSIARTRALPLSAMSTFDPTVVML